MRKMQGVEEEEEGEGEGVLGLIEPSLKGSWEADL